ncbi:hypothetical protein AB0M34_32720 [Nocardia sp. NPDC050193]
MQAQSGHLLYGPNKSRHGDRMLATFEQAGFDEDGADQAAAAVFMFVLGNAVGRQPTSRSIAASTATETARKPNSRTPCPRQPRSPGNIRGSAAVSKQSLLQPDTTPHLAAPSNSVWPRYWTGLPSGSPHEIRSAD